VSTLRVLLIEENPEELERISSELAHANHAVLPAAGFEEASEALSIQKFDVVLVGSLAQTNETANFAQRLRALEGNTSNSLKTPVLSISGNTITTVADLVSRVSEAAALHPRGEADDTGLHRAELCVFEPEEFRAQVADDPDLLVEIINLFLLERGEQTAEMRTALASGDYQRLARVAHTIKGSLGSLHAPRAISAAQELEAAAKQQLEDMCRFRLANLEQNLSILEPSLLALRESASQR
jgi:HPt (histidine-containing phosphotransfer) domain-containing protein/CheY-like chemotaxis protein